MSKPRRPRSPSSSTPLTRPDRASGEGAAKRPRKPDGEAAGARRAQPRDAGERIPTRRPPPRKPAAEIPPAEAEPELSEKLQKIAGLQAVTAVFRRDPERVARLYYSEQLKTAAGPFCAQMAKLHRPYRLLEEDELEKVAGSVLHGGIVAAAMARPVTAFGSAQFARWAKTGKPLVVLDGIGNPNNLGAIARTMAFFGLEHLLLTDHPEQAGLSDSAYRVAEGGLEYLEIARLADPAGSLARLKPHYRVIGTVLERKAAGIEVLAGDRPVALVLGNEERGLGKATLAACDGLITLPALGSMQSLNVAATAAILIHHLACGTDRGRRTGTAKPHARRPSLPARRKRPE